MDDLPLRFNQRPHGVYALAVRTAANASGQPGELVIRRRPVLLGTD